jgi:hypothetical protein
VGGSDPQRAIRILVEGMDGNEVARIAEALENAAKSEAATP